MKFRSIDEQLSVAQSLRDTGKIPIALEVLSDVLAQNPVHPAARFQRSLCLLTMGFYEIGWRDYELRLHDHPLARFLGGPRPFSHDRELLIHGEQGIGDEIMFASCFHDLYLHRGRSFDVIADARLHALFAHSFPYLHVRTVDSRDSKTLDLSDTDTLNRSIMMIGTLGRYYRNNIRDFPAKGSGYLKPEPVRLEFFRSILARDKLNVGLAWRGGIVETGRYRRSLAFSDLRPLTGIAGVRFYNLQHDSHSDEYLNAVRRGEFLDLSGGLWEDWLELATFISALDLVVSVQSSIVHLCGALGVPCLALIPAAPEWRYGFEGGSMPWYSSVKLYRQMRLGDWSPVLDRVRGELLREVSMVRGV